MPRKRAASVEEIFGSLQRENVFNENGSIKKKTDPVWKKASSLLKKVIDSTTLYFYVCQNWNGLKDKLEEYWSQQVCTVIKNIKTEEKKIINNCQEFTFVIDFDEEEWDSIKPKLKEDDPKKKVLQKGWCHAFIDKIWTTQNLPCPFTFKKGYVSTSGQSIKFNGYCRECGNSLQGICNAVSEHPKFDITTRDSRNIRHYKKRPLSTTLREKSKIDLFHVKALKFKRQEAQNYMEYGKIEGPLVHNTPVLRKTRQEAVFEKYGVKPTENIIEAIVSMKSEEKWCHTIQEVGDFPFHVIFWTSEQLDLWKIVSQDNVSVSIDAAGRFLKKIKTTSEITAHIFLYILSISIGGRIYPIIQFISEYQAAIFIKHCLCKWIESGAPKPREVVTDGSSALQNAVCLSFSNCSYQQYLSSCYNYIMGSINELPFCFLRSDIAHLIKSISRWTCFDTVDPKVKDFYLRIIGYLSKLDNFSEFKAIIKSVFIVCQSKGTDHNSEVNVNTKHLLELIKFHTISYCAEDCICDFCNEHKLGIENVTEIEDKESEESNLKMIKKEIKNIQKDALNYITDSGNNQFFCPNLVKNFIILCAEFAVWTNIMTKHFKSNNIVATSGRSESLFCDLRHVTNINRPISGHLFLSTYIDFLNGTIKLARGFLENQNLQSPVIRKSVDLNKSKLAGLDIDESTSQNSTIKKHKERGKYLEPCLDITVQYTRPKTKPLKNVIKNGILCDPIIYNG